MSEEKKLALECVRGLVSLTQSQYEKAKIIFWYLCGDDKNTRNFLRIAFQIAEEHRPKLIGLNQ